MLTIREIAQHIGGESKYRNVFSGLLRVGDEEGPAGLFSGLVPALISDFVLIWGTETLLYGAQRLLLRAEKNAKDDEHAAESLKKAREWTPLLAPFVVSSWAYPFSVVSTVVAVTGSR